MSGSTDSALPTARPTVPPISNAQCRAFAKGTKSFCDRSRICAKCLEIEGCMINQAGECWAQANGEYDQLKDYKLAEAMGVVLPKALDNASAPLDQALAFQFRALDAVYCQSNDTVCSRCIKEKFWAPTGATDADSRFCVGENGCVCISNCEMPVDPTCISALDTESPISTPSTGVMSTGASEHGLPTAVWVVIALLLVIGTGLIVVRRRHRHSKIPRMPFAIPVQEDDDSSHHGRTFSTSFEISRLQQQSTSQPTAPTTTTTATVDIDPDLEPYSWSFHQSDGIHNNAHSSYRRMS